MDEPEEFSLYIDFTKSEGDPSRVFHAMANLIDSFYELDNQLIGVLGEKSETLLVLDEIEAGSLRAWLRNVLVALPDDAIHDLNLKKLAGHFLVKAKYRIVEWLTENPNIETIEQVRVLEGELISMAEQTNIRQIPAYSPINTQALLSQINNIYIATKQLEDNDKVVYESSVGNVNLRRDVVINEGLIRQILTREVIRNEGIRLIKVKKPDYLGKSKWVFRYGGHIIEAKIEDEKWLEEFQKKKNILHPGDSLRVNMLEEVSYGHESEVVHTFYAISKVVEIVSPTHYEQSHLGL